MTKKKGFKECPNCGSRNLHLEGYGSKGRQIIQCNECDEVFEIFAGRSHDHGRVDNRKSRTRSKPPEDEFEEVDDSYEEEYDEEELDFDDDDYQYEDEDEYSR